MIFGLLLAIGLTTLATAAHADVEGVVELGDTTWQVHPDAGRIDVTVELSVRHAIPDRADGSYTYFDTWGIALPYEPTDLSVTWSGQPVTPRVEAGEERGVGVQWSLPNWLRHGQTRTAVVTASFESGPPRSDPLLAPRVQPAYLQTLVGGWGADGREVTIEMPTSMDATAPDGWTSEVAGQVRTWHAQDPGPSFVPVVGVGTDADRGLLRAEVGGTDVLVRHYDNDEAWGREVRDFVTEAIPALEELVGGQPLESELTIREDPSPERDGWGGWYDTDTDVIAVGEDYDRVTWLHELSHHWFDDDEFDETWLREGMAEMAPAVLGDELGLDVDPPDQPAQDLDLESWDTQVDEARPLQHEDPEAWHDLTGRLYGGAHHVLATIRAEIGDEAWRRVVAAHITEQSAWDGPGDEQVSVSTGWRELVDLVEAGTDWDGVGELVVTHVDSDAADLLTARDEAVRAHRDLATFQWAVPLEVRRDMQAWRHEAALEAIRDASARRERIESLREQADTAEVNLPSLQHAWEQGLPGELDASISDLKASLDDLAAMRALAAEHDIAVPNVVDRLRLDELDDVRASIEQVSDTIPVVAGAVTQPRPDGPVATVGLWGSDPAAATARAREALAAGDLDAAREAAREAVAMLERAPDVGLRRLGIATGITVVLLAAARILVRRRRRTTLTA